MHLNELLLSVYHTCVLALSCHFRHEYRGVNYDNPEFLKVLGDYVKFSTRQVVEFVPDVEQRPDVALHVAQVAFVITHIERTLKGGKATKARDAQDVNITNMQAVDRAMEDLLAADPADLLFVLITEVPTTVVTGKLDKDDNRRV